MPNHRGGWMRSEKCPVHTLPKGKDLDDWAKNQMRIGNIQECDGLPHVNDEKAIITIKERKP